MSFQDIPTRSVGRAALLRAENKNKEKTSRIG